MKESNFFTAYMATFIEKMDECYKDQIDKLRAEFEEKLFLENQKASIYLQMTEENGLFYQIITLWVSFCEFELKSKL